MNPSQRGIIEIALVSVFLTLGGGGGWWRLLSGCQVAFPPWSLQSCKDRLVSVTETGSGRAARCSSCSNQVTVTKPGVFWLSGMSSLNQSSSPWSWQCHLLEKQTNASVSPPEHCYTRQVTISEHINAPKNVWFICQILQEMKYCHSIH